MNSPRCGTTGCPEPVANRGYCTLHYRRRLRRGLYGYRPAGPVVAHIAALRDLGWTWGQISDAAGVAVAVAHGLAQGTRDRVTADRAQALLSVPLVPVLSHRVVDGCGTRRRVQGLAWMGWPRDTVADEAGVPRTTLRDLHRPGHRVPRVHAAAVAEVYERWSHLPGPSRCTASRARALGWAPPVAWDDDLIDDPDTQPDLGVVVEGPRVDLAEVEHLAAFGCHLEEIARRLGVSAWAIRQARRAAGVAA